jgi:peptidoglycan/xylan/chitin deacetylase (PgdA/CDA1 family)
MLQRAGMFDAWRRDHEKDIAILMFHGTPNPLCPSTWMPLRPQITTEHVDWCLGIIRNYYNFISLDEAVGILKGEKPPVENGIAITLDDGYRNNIVDALPVFKKYGAPITIFLTVSSIDNRKPLWFDRLDYALQFTDVENHKFKIGRKHFKFSSGGRERLASSYSRFRKLIKNQYTDEVEFYMKLEEVISRFEQAGGKRLDGIFEDDPWSALLSWDEIAKIQGDGVSFGSHTMDHFRVSHLGENLLRYQFSNSKSKIEKVVGNACRHIAYPDGNYSETAVKIAKECGFESGVTTIEGINRIGCGIMTLKRISVPLTPDPTELIAYVSGFSKAVSKTIHLKNRY